MEDDLSPRKAVYDFSREQLESYSLDELVDRIEQLQLEIKRCEAEISGKESTKETAENLFRS